MTLLFHYWNEKEIRPWLKHLCFHRKIFYSPLYLFLPFLKSFFTRTATAVITSGTHLCEARQEFHLHSRMHLDAPSGEEGMWLGKASSYMGTGQWSLFLKVPWAFLEFWEGTSQVVHKSAIFSQPLALEIFHLVNNVKYTLSNVNVLTKTNKSQGTQSSRKAETLPLVCCHLAMISFHAASFIDHRDTEIIRQAGWSVLKWSVEGKDSAESSVSVGH